MGRLERQAGKRRTLELVRRYHQAGNALDAMEARTRGLTNLNRGRSVPSVASDVAAYLTGWREDFTPAKTPGVFNDLHSWIRQRLMSESGAGDPGMATATPPAWIDRDPRKE